MFYDFYKNKRSGKITKVKHGSKLTSKWVLG